MLTMDDDGDDEMSCLVLAWPHLGPSESESALRCVHGTAQPEYCTVTVEEGSLLHFLWSAEVLLNLDCSASVSASTRPV